MFRKVHSLFLLLVLMCLFSGCATQYTSMQGDLAYSAKSCSFWDAGADTMEDYFALAKESRPELIAFLRRMPKGADLHNHVSGATYSDYMLDSAQQNNLNYNLVTDKFTSDPPREDEIVTIEDLIQNSAYLQQFLNLYSMRGWFENTTNGHDHFFDTFGVMSSSRRSKSEMIAEMVCRNMYENVSYLELMTGCVPSGFNNQFYDAIEDFDINDMEDAFDKVLPLLNAQNKDAIIEFINSLVADVDTILKHECPFVGKEIQNPVTYRLIPQLYRSSDARFFFADAVSAIFAVQCDFRVVGVNMVGAEDDPRARRNFADQMKILDFLYRKMGMENFTLHAGELVLRESPVEAMWERISQTIEFGHARRIGHGIAIAWELDVDNVLDTMRNQGILVEICLSSNESILGIKDDDHPFMMYRQNQVPVCLNTDDEGVSRGNLTMEYVKAAQRYDLSYEDLQEMARNSLEYSFMSGKSLYDNRDYTRIDPQFTGVRDTRWTPSEAAQKLMEENQKLALEVRLERAFVDFEKGVRNGFSF